MTAPGLSQSALEIVTSAMRLLHLVVPGEDITAEEASDGLTVLNQMLDAWQIERLMIYTVGILDFPFVPGQQNYNLGTGGDFNVPRPTKIENASTILDPNSANPIEYPLTYTTLETEWQNILVKSVSTTWPWVVYDDGGFPFRQLRFWPIPASPQAVRLYMWQALAQFPDLVSPILFPPGYAEAVRYNLAIRLSDEFHGLLGQATITMAREGLARIRSSNVEVAKLTCDDVTNSRSQGTAGWSSNIPPIY